MVQRAYVRLKLCSVDGRSRSTNARCGSNACCGNKCGNARGINQNKVNFRTPLPIAQRRDFTIAYFYDDKYKASKTHELWESGTITIPSLLAYVDLYF